MSVFDWKGKPSVFANEVNKATNTGDKPFMKMSGNNFGTAIEQWSLEGKLIKNYSSVSAASRDLDISKSAISMCMNGKRHSAGGFIFKVKIFNQKLRN